MPPAYIAGKSGTLSYNSTTYTAENVNVNFETGSVDVTNLASGGFHENITDIKKLSISGTLTLDANALSSLPTDGSLNSCTFAVTGWKTATGSARLTTQSVKAAPK